MGTQIGIANKTMIINKNSDFLLSFKHLSKILKLLFIIHNIIISMSAYICILLNYLYGCESKR